MYYKRDSGERSKLRKKMRKSEYTRQPEGTKKLKKNCSSHSQTKLLSSQ